jgi:glycerophosphoryl diester phosphodiesterase
VRRHRLEERTIVSSVDPASLRRVRGVATSISYPDDRYALSTRPWLSPAVRCGLACLRAALPRRIARMVEAAGASAATLHHSVVSPALVRRCPVPVYAWTVDDAGLARRLESLGVAAIITNDPRIFL